MSILSEPIIQSIWIRLLLPPCAAICSGRELRAVDEAFRIALAERDVAGGVLVEQRVEEQEAALRDRRGMRHQRHLAEAARALVGVEHLVQHRPRRARPSLRRCARPRSAPRCRRSACPDRRAAWCCATWPSTRRACGVVKTSSVGMFGLQVMPFFAVEAPPCHSWPSASPMVRSVPGPGKCSAWNCCAVQPFRCAAAAPRCASAQAATGSALSTREAEKIASASLPTATSSVIARKDPLRPGGGRIGDDVPVDVEAGDLLQRRLIGDRIGLVGARDLGRILARRAASDRRRRWRAAPCWRRRPWPTPS